MKSDNKPHKHGHNVVELAAKKKTFAAAARDEMPFVEKLLVQNSLAENSARSEFSESPVLDSAAGEKPLADFGNEALAPKSGGDERVKEAMRLAQAFLAIEDAAARRALVDLAERLVSYDWVRKVQ